MKDIFTKVYNQVFELEDYESQLRALDSSTNTLERLLYLARNELINSINTISCKKSNERKKALERADQLIEKISSKISISIEYL